MKLILSLGLLAFVTYVQAASIVRETRNTEGIIPTIVEEILKVELKSDLKKNSNVGEPVVVEEVQEIKKNPEEPTIVVTEDKIEKITSGDVTKEIVSGTKKVVETVVPVVVENVNVPLVRNVVKEEIPQVEELRTVPVMAVGVESDKPAVIDIIPEPVQALVEAEPKVEVEQPKLKTEVIPEIVKPEVEVKKVEVAVPAQLEKVEDPSKNENIEKIEEKVVVVETIVPEIKKLVEDEKVVSTIGEVNTPVAANIAAPAADETVPETKQDTPNRPQQIIAAVTNAVGNVQNAVGNLFNRNPSSTANDAVADESDASATTTARPGNFISNALNTLQNLPQNAANTISQALGANNAAQSDGSTSTNPFLSTLTNLPQQLGAIFQNVQNGVQNIIPSQNNAAVTTTTTSSPTTKQSDEPPKVVAVDNKIDEPASKSVSVETPHDVVVEESPIKEVVLPVIAPEVEVKKTESEHPVV